MLIDVGIEAATAGMLPPRRNAGSTRVFSYKTRQRALGER
jgi:hypothetical protein